MTRESFLEYDTFKGNVKLKEIEKGSLSQVVNKLSQQINGVISLGNICHFKLQNTQSKQSLVSLIQEARVLTSLCWVGGGK